jgi:hypothetical protein
MSPLQKSEIVKMMKMSPDKPITAAIGDGGNDVAMIQVHIYPYNNVIFHQLMLRKRTPEKLKFEVRKVAPIPIYDTEHITGFFKTLYGHRTAVLRTLEVLT